MRSANGRSISSAAACAVPRLTGSNPSARSQSATAVASVTFGRETMTRGRSATNLVKCTGHASDSSRDLKAAHFGTKGGAVRDNTELQAEGEIRNRAVIMRLIRFQARILNDPA